jgi:Carboxypeptidase regulatory-like domain/TonB-dependent Receptor Plug Domain
MHRKFLVFVCLMSAILGAAGRAHAQGAANSSLTGTVFDVSGAVMPGANVVAKNVATGAQFEGVANEQGEFNIPAMPPGTYAVTVSLSGFKTAVLNNVVLSASVPATVKATLEVGKMEEVVTVTAGSEIVQTQSTQVATTLSVKQISNLPLSTRNLMDALTMLPGVNTPGTPRNSSINGLPQSAINITIDGVNVQDNYLKGQDGGDGFFSLISPRVDAIEQVTVSSATPDAGNAGQGSAQIAFVTRSGTNRYQGSVYDYYRDPMFNSNYWFNNRDVAPDPKTGKAPKDQVKLQQIGGRLGGPIVFPGFNGHDKAFFFANMEKYHQPNEVTRQRTILNPAALAGNFQYANSAGVVQSVNVLTLAAQNGQLATPDPVITKLLQDIQSSTTKTGGVQALSDPNQQRFTFANGATNDRYFPTARLDYNISKNHRASFSTNYQKYDAFPDTLNSRDPAFPGFPNAGGQNSTRLTVSGSVRSTVTTTLVNEARVGYTNSTVKFSPEVTVADFKGPSVADQNGYAISLSSAYSGLTNPTAQSAPSQRAAPNFEAADTINWNRGSHNITAGGSWQQVGVWLLNQTIVPSVSFGIVSADPASTMFSAANFPGASSAQLSNAQGLYNLLTGRVSQISGNAVLNENTNKYSYLGDQVQRGRMHEMGLYAQDNWRWKRNVTVNYGLRWEVQQPFYPLNDVYSFNSLQDIWGVSGVGNMFKPGVMTGTKPTYTQYKKGSPAFKTDWNNLAPSLGLTYRPTADKGLLRSVLGQDGDTVLRGAYALSYERPGMADYTDVYGSNQGLTVSATRSATLGNLGALPVLFRDTNNLGPGAFPDAPVYPLTPLITSQVNYFDPNIQTPYTESWTAGVQRAITKNDVVELRYVGNRHLQGWIDYNVNEVNILENGFLNEFKVAMANLKANQAAGRGNTFAYTGAAGTNPLPTFLAFFTGQSSASATNPAAYTGNNWTSSTFLPFLAPTSANPYGFASTGSNGFIGNATFRQNGLNAGVPANFFITNPDVIGGAFLRGNGGYTRYDSMQIDYRRRLVHGFQVQANYALATSLVSQRVSFRRGRVSVQQTGGDEGSVRHSLKMNGVWELPFGRDRRYFSGARPWVNHLINGWEFDGVGRVQSGQILSFGNVRLVGMSDKDLQKAYKIRKTPGIVYILPQDIVDNTIKAFSTSATTSDGYSASLGAPTGRYLAPASEADCIQVVSGDCAPLNHFVTGPKFVRADLSVVKRTKITGRVNAEVRFDFLNAFNNINFLPTTTISTSNISTFGQVTSAYRDANNTQDPGGRLGQLTFRLSW